VLALTSIVITSRTAKATRSCAHYHSAGAARRKSVVGGGNNKNVKVLPEDYASEAEARAAAEAELARTQRSQATLSYALALGRLELFPKMSVIVSGFKPEIDEIRWFVKTARHTIGEGGFTTALELEVRDDPTSDRHRSHFRKCDARRSGKFRLGQLCCVGFEVRAVAALATGRTRPVSGVVSVTRSNS
jgi:phage protein D